MRLELVMRNHGKREKSHGHLTTDPTCDRLLVDRRETRWSEFHQPEKTLMLSTTSENHRSRLPGNMKLHTSPVDLLRIFKLRLGNRCRSTRPRLAESKEKAQEHQNQMQLSESSPAIAYERPSETVKNYWRQRITIVVIAWKFFWLGLELVRIKLPPVMYSLLLRVDVDLRGNCHGKCLQVLCEVFGALSPYARRNVGTPFSSDQDSQLSRAPSRLIFRERLCPMTCGKPTKPGLRLLPPQIK